MNPAIQIHELQVQKNGRCICSVPELKIEVREHVMVTGANGAGKTTLLRVLMGIETPQTGKCQNPIPAAKRVYVHQAPYLFRGTVEFNVTYGLKVRGVPRPQRISSVQSWLERFGIRGLADRHCQTLSGGERRRVALARAFVLQPELLLLDEPFADLDDAGIACVMREVAKFNGTVVIASPVSPATPSLVKSYHLIPPQ